MAWALVPSSSSSPPTGSDSRQQQPVAVKREPDTITNDAFSQPRSQPVYPASNVYHSNVPLSINAPVVNGSRTPITPGSDKSPDPPVLSAISSSSSSSCSSASSTSSNSVCLPPISQIDISSPPHYQQLPSIDAHNHQVAGPPGPLHSHRYSYPYNAAPSYVYSTASPHHSSLPRMPHAITTGNSQAVRSSYAITPPAVPQNSLQSPVTPDGIDSQYHLQYQQQGHHYRRSQSHIGLGIVGPTAASTTTTLPYYGSQQPAFQAGKDIKRRTKTGCYTCRKRRIKCDEQRPTCNNCDKSRRVCFAYDPLFCLVVERTRHCSRIRQVSAIFKRPPSSGTASPANPGLLSLDDTNAIVKDPPLPTPLPISAQNEPLIHSSRTKMRIDSLLDAASVLEKGMKVEAIIASQIPPCPATQALPSNVVHELQFGCNEWVNVGNFYTLNVGPSLDNLFGVDRFASICDSIEKRNPSLMGMAVIEAMRRLLSVLQSSTVEPCILNVEKLKDKRIEELRISTDYMIFRAIVQSFESSSESELLPVADYDKDLLTKLLVLNSLVQGASPGGSTSKPVQEYSLDNGLQDDRLDEWETRDIVEDGRKCWHLLLHIANGGVIPEQRISELASAVTRCPLHAMVVIGLLYYIKTEEHGRTSVEDWDSRLRMRLFDIAASDMISQRLLTLCLYAIKASSSKVPAEYDSLIEDAF